MFSMDVKALYPSLDSRSTAEAIEDIVKERTVKFININVTELSRYVAVAVDDHLVRERTLSEVVMTRKKRGGRRPSVTGTARGKEWNDESLWLSASRIADEDEIKALLALAISVDVEYLMQNNIFKVGDVLYKQTEGGMHCALHKL